MCFVLLIWFWVSLVVRVIGYVCMCWLIIYVIVKLVNFLMIGGDGEGDDRDDDILDFF